MSTTILWTVWGEIKKKRAVFLLSWWQETCKLYDTVMWSVDWAISSGKVRTRLSYSSMTDDWNPDWVDLP